MIIIIYTYLDIEVTTADIIDGLIVDHAGTIGMLQSCVCCQDTIVGFHNSSRNLRSWINREFEFRFLSILDRKSFHQQRTESWSSSSSKRVEHEESLKTSAVFSLLPNSLQDSVDMLLPDGVMSSGIVVSSIFFSTNKLLRMEEVSETSGPNFIQDSRFKINVDRSRSEFARIGFSEKSSQRLLRRDLSIRDRDSVIVDSMFSTVEFPASISYLSSSLSNMNGDTFSLK